MTISKEQAIERLKEEGYQIYKDKFTPKYFKSLNLKIDHLIDIGVNKGTPKLYDAFQNSHMILIDPLNLSLEDLEDWQLQKYNITKFKTALGDYEGFVTINSSSINAQSSILKRVDYRRNEHINTEDVPIITLDALIKSNNFKGSFGIKIDAEGYENRILRGASETLQTTNFVICEASISNRFLSGSSFSDISKILFSQGFEIADFLSLNNLPKGYFDCLFLKK